MADEPNEPSQPAGDGQRAKPASKRELIILIRPDYSSPEAIRRTAERIYEAIRRHAERQQNQE